LGVPKVLLVINAEVVDQELLDQYRAAAKPSMAKYGAKMLAGGDDAEVIEGQPFGTRVVVVEFPNREVFSSVVCRSRVCGTIGDAFEGHQWDCAAD